MLLPITRQRTVTYRLSQLQALIDDVSSLINAFLFDSICGHRALYQFFFLTKKAKVLKNTKVTWTGPYSLRNQVLEAL